MVATSPAWAQEPAGWVAFAFGKLTWIWTVNEHPYVHQIATKKILAFQCLPHLCLLARGQKSFQHILSKLPSSIIYSMCDFSSIFHRLRWARSLWFFDQLAMYKCINEANPTPHQLVSLEQTTIKTARIHISFFCGKHAKHNKKNILDTRCYF